MRYRAMLAAIVAASLLAGVALIYILPARYEAVAQVRIGQIAGLGLFEEPGTLNSRILAEYGIDSGARTSAEQPYVRTAQVRRGTTNVVEWIAVGGTSDEARELLNEIYKNISDDHRQHYEAGMAVLKAALADLERRRAELDQTYKDLGTLIDHAESRSDGEVGVVIMQQGQISQTVADLDARVPTLIANMSPPRSVPTALLGTITADDVPASPQKLVILAAMTLLGVMAGVAAAIIRAGVSRPRP